MKLLLSFWQIFQNTLGLILVVITKATVKGRIIDGELIDYYVARRFNHTWSGVSLGNFIIFMNIINPDLNFFVNP